MENKSVVEKLGDKVSFVLEEYNTLKGTNEAMRNELTALKAEKELKNQEIEKLTEENAMKDLEIEEILSKIESILG